jgi:hypothetical protein
VAESAAMSEPDPVGWAARIARAFQGDEPLSRADQEVASATGVDSTTFSRWKANKNVEGINRALAVVGRAAAQTGYRLEWILFGMGPQRERDAMSERDAAAWFCRVHCRHQQAAIDAVDRRYPPNELTAEQRFMKIAAANVRLLEADPLMPSEDD